MHASRMGHSTPLAIRELLRPGALPHAVRDLTVRETHISWVVLTGPFAYKIKKPVRFEFIDASTLRQRRHYCEEEVRLNQRFASDLYLDVVAITRNGGRAVIGGDGPAVEYAVRMRQFAAEDELPMLLARNDVNIEELTALGELLAQFHLRAAVSPWVGAAERTRATCDSDRLQQRIRAGIAWTTRRRPILILMHGVPGSGKTWLSQKLLPELHAIRVRSDLERKRLAGMSATEHEPAGIRQGIYSAQFSRRTYDRLAQCAEGCLRAGFNTIVDAAFLDPADRATFRAIARQLDARFTIVACHADPATLAARVMKRSIARGDASDATLSVLDARLRDLQPFTAAELQSLIPIDTTDSDAARRVVDAINAKPTPAR